MRQSDEIAESEALLPEDDLPTGATSSLELLEDSPLATHRHDYEEGFRSTDPVESVDRSRFVTEFGRSAIELDVNAPGVDVVDVAEVCK